MKEKEQLKIAKDFIQYILDQWEIDTGEAQEMAIKTLEKMKGAENDKK